MGDAVTIKDVAKRANVSVATVSRALNGHVNVADAVRRRIVSIADELRYTPHHAARSLSSRHTRTIGVVLPDLHGEFFAGLMLGIDGVARERGLHLLVSSYRGRSEEQAAAWRAMRGRVDGLLVMSSGIASDGHLGELLASGLPSVLMNSHASAPGCREVSLDNRGGARAMVRHLVGCGYRRIAFIAGSKDTVGAHERLCGYRDGMVETGHGEQPWVVDGDSSEASGHHAGRLLLSQTVRPDAVFAANDLMAMGCLFAFNQAGVDIPGEIALAGFDDIPLARYAHPALTTMRVDIRELGARAMRVLLDSAESGTVLPVRLAAELIVRQSTRARADKHDDRVPVSC